MLGPNISKFVFGAGGTSGSCVQSWALWAPHGLGSWAQKSLCAPSHHQRPMSQSPPLSDVTTSKVESHIPCLTSSSVLAATLQG
eukprot:COSAG04_NODE_751_length_10585_cov_8.084970_2_plen_84_part_00